MVARLSPSLPPISSNNMNLSSMIHTDLPSYLHHRQPLPSPPSPTTQLPSFTTHSSINQPSVFRSTQSSPPFPSVSSLTPHPLPKLPPLSSQLAPILSAPQPSYHHHHHHRHHHHPLASVSSLPQVSRHAQPPSLISTESTSFVSRPPHRISPLQLPHPSTKPILSDHHPVSYHTATQPTVSPVSVTQPAPESTYCASPVSTSHPPDHPHTSHSTLPAVTPPRPRIQDSLIARLRDFNSPNPPAPAPAPAPHPVPAISKREPQIRDTSESLAIGYVDNMSPSVQPHHLASHYDTVSPDRPHACRKCSATFRRRDNLMAHIRAQHKGERPFKCDVCGFRFIKKDHAMKHWKVVHLKERPFVCTRCNSRFGQRSDLNKHVRSVHLRIKPFECEHCGLRFSHRGNQIRHQAVVHEKKKPFTCTQCSSSFAEKSNLLKHCQAVHKIGATYSS